MLERGPEGSDKATAELVIARLNEEIADLSRRRLKLQVEKPLGWGCSILFGLPFGLLGVLFIEFGRSTGPEGIPGVGKAAMWIGSFFAVISVAFFVVSWSEARTSEKKLELVDDK